MKKISSNFIFPINSPPIKNGVLVTNDDGEVLDVLKNADGLEDVLFVEGFLCPGFVNSHCHLELSHLKGLLPEKQGLVAFIEPIIKLREADKELVGVAMLEAEEEMKRGGIVAVGDICNTRDSFIMKSKSKMQYHNYIEVISLDPSKAESAYLKGMELYNESTGLDIKSSLVPHAPYTASSKLLNMLGGHARATKTSLCIHNQESEHENALFYDASGPIKEFYAGLGIDLNYFKPTKTNSMEAVLQGLGEGVSILMVHNTYTTAEDIRTAESYNIDISYCLCPNANLYIENKLPDFNMFTRGQNELVLGTDSLASNWNLSIVQELKTISSADPAIDLQTLLTWATRNGANYLGFGDQLGTFDKGKKPGINLLYNVDVNHLSITKDTDVRVLG